MQNIKEGFILWEDSLGHTLKTSEGAGVLLEVLSSCPPSCFTPEWEEPWQGQWFTIVGGGAFPVRNKVL